MDGVTYCVCVEDKYGDVDIIDEFNNYYDADEELKWHVEHTSGNFSIRRKVKRRLLGMEKINLKLLKEVI